MAQVQATLPRSAVRFRDAALIALFAPLIFLPAILHMAGVAQTTARDEMRNLVQRPRLPATLAAWRGFGAEMDAYLADHFGLRPYLLAIGNRLNFAVRLPAGGNRLALPGKDDWLFWANDIEQHSGLRLLSRGEVTRWIQSLATLHDWLAARGIRFVFVIAPDKSEIYPEHLPDGVPAAPFTAMDQMAAALAAQTGFDFVDLRQLLKAAKPGGQLYYRTDSHWNSRGAYLALRNVLDGRLAKGAALPAFSDYRLDPTPFAGDLVQLLSLACCISEPREAPIRSFPDPVRDHGLVVKDGQEGRWIDTTHRDLPAIFVYGDSFSDAWLPFLADVASRVVYRRNDHPLHAADVEAARPGLFIYEIVQRRVSEPPQPLVSP